jgi:hypothetical protein
MNVETAGKARMTRELKGNSALSKEAGSLEAAI